MNSGPDVSAATQARVWKQRHDRIQARAFAAHQREFAATCRSEGSAVRETASAIRAEAALVRDDGARTRDDAARVRDRAAVVRDQAALSRDEATRTREEATRQRLVQVSSTDREGWKRILELDRVASEQGRGAATHDREAAMLDREAADKDREASERDHTAAARDRDAADKDREAAEKDRAAADADRTAADSDRVGSEDDLELAEARLTQAERLASMGRLAAGIAHELNTPLATLLLSLQGLEREVHLPTVLPLVADARLAAERIASVLAETRAWLFGAEAQPVRRAFDLAQVVRDALPFSAAEVERVAVLVVTLNPASVMGVPARIGELVTNLMLNAAHAITGPRADQEIRVTTSINGDLARLEVSDTGRGIGPDLLPHIFDPFFTTREGRGGTGLGLAIGRRIASEHGGTLTVESEPGRGSTFRLEIPLADRTALASSIKPPARPRVLLIDDDPAFVRGMNRMLKSRCDVTIAEDGVAALALFEAGQTWNVVLCDVMMPNMNGADFFHRLQARFPKAAAQLVFITGGATTNQTAAFLQSIANVVLPKPFDTRHIFALIDERMAAPE